MDDLTENFNSPATPFDTSDASLDSSVTFSPPNFSPIPQATPLSTATVPPSGPSTPFSPVTSAVDDATKLPTPRKVRPNKKSLGGSPAASYVDNSSNVYSFQAPQKAGESSGSHGAPVAQEATMQNGSTSNSIYSFGQPSAVPSFFNSSRPASLASRAAKGLTAMTPPSVASKPGQPISSSRFRAEEEDDAILLSATPVSRTERNKTTPAVRPAGTPAVMIDPANLQRELKIVNLMLVLATTCILVTRNGSYYEKLITQKPYDYLSSNPDLKESGATRKHQAQEFLNTIMKFYRTYLMDVSSFNEQCWEENLKNIFTAIKNEDGWVIHRGSNSRFGYALLAAGRTAGLNLPTLSKVPVTIESPQTNFYLCVPEKMKAYSALVKSGIDLSRPGNEALALAIWENELQEILIRRYYDLAMDPKYKLPDTDKNYAKLKKIILSFLYPVDPYNPDQKAPVEQRVQIRALLALEAGKEDFLTLLLEKLSDLELAVGPHNKGMQTLLSDIKALAETEQTLLRSAIASPYF